MKDSIKQNPLWLDLCDDVPERYPWLSEDETAAVCVIGGGITGALCALELSRDGVDTVLLSASPVGLCGSAYSSGAMQCEIPGGLSALCDGIGMDKAVRVYEECDKALDEIEALCGEFTDDCGFVRQDSLCFTTDDDKADDLRQEYLLRRRSGIPVELIDSLSLRDEFSFPIAGGILTRHRAARMDPYRFCHMAMQKAVEHGARVYENTSVEKVENDTGSYVLTTSTHRRVHCEKLVIAIGSDVADFIKNSGTRRTSFSVVTKPVSAFSGWEGGCILNSLDRPQMTLLKTPDNRIFASGLSTGLVSRQGRMAGILPLETLSERKFEHMEQLLSSLFPSILETSPEYGFATTSIECDDGLPKVGCHDEYENCYFASAGGENGILFSKIAAGMIADMYRGERTPLMKVFSPMRK